MLAKKIIPCLDMKDSSVVKGVHFVGIKKVGNLVESAKLYEKQGADEIAFLDIAATNENRKTRTDLVRKISNNISIPLVVGGGIKSVEDVKEVFEAGASKVCINTAAVKNPELIKEASEKFGKDKIIIAIDFKDNFVYIKGGFEKTNLDAVEWTIKAESLGAGAILPTSIEKDGTKAGYNIRITRKIAESVSIPIIASGGAGTLEDIKKVLTKGKADAALAASIFHYGKYTVKEVKKYLRKNNIEVRT